MDETEVWAAVDRGRRELVGLLRSLAPADWDRPSLCEAWTVREVAAHLTLPGLPPWRLYPLFLRYPGSTNRTIRDGSKAVARRLDNRQITDSLERMVGFHRHFPGLGSREALIDVIGHTQDITLPIGRELPVPPPEIAEAADHVLSYGGRGNARVFHRLPSEGHRLTATDVDWSTGAGPEVTGTMRDLFLLLTGRTVHLDRLGGEGADRLRGRVSA